MIFTSSFPINPLSPLWGFNDSKAIFGLIIPKSFLNVWFNNSAFLQISSLVIEAETASNGKWLVTSAILKFW